VARVVDVRPEETRGLVWSFLYFFFLLGSYYVLRPLRDEMGIAGGIDHLQWLFTATLSVMLVAVPIWSALAARLPPRRLIAIVYRFFLGNLLLFFALFQLTNAQVPVARAFFVWTSVFNLFVVSVFWSFMADIFRPEQGKRLFAFVAAGGSAGAIAGPLLTATMVGRIGPINLLLIAAMLLEAAAQCAARLGAWAARRDPARGSGEPGKGGEPGQSAEPDQASERSVPAGSAAPASQPLSDTKGLDEGRDGDAIGAAVGGTALAAVRLLVTSPYLAAIALYVLFMTSTATVGYLLQARLIAAEGLSSAARTALFARIDLIVNVGSAATQALLAGRVMTRFGMAPALLLSPLLTIAASLAVSAAPRLGVLIAGNVARRVAEFSVSQPARQVLFTILTREEKYKPKAFIDTVVFRSGDVASSWAFTAIARQGVSVPVLALCVLPIALAWLAVAAWLARRHEKLATTPE
jgi:AAA family ATP:ADP antiporter